jgi:hypothetical protein
VPEDWRLLSKEAQGGMKVAMGTELVIGQVDLIQRRRRPFDRLERRARVEWALFDAGAKGSHNASIDCSLEIFLIQQLLAVTGA